MRLLDGLAYSKQPHFWMVFIWTKLIVFQNKVVGNLWRPRDQKDKKNKSFIVPMEYFFQVLFDPHRETLIRAMVSFFYSSRVQIAERSDAKSAKWSFGLKKMIYFDATLF